jgi:hypothetical protein
MRTLRWLYLTWRRWRDGGWRDGVEFFTGPPRLSSYEQVIRHYDRLDAQRGIDGPTWTWPMTKTKRPTAARSGSGNLDDTTA